MALPNIYARRKRQSEKSEADVYQYTTISPKLRQQVVLLIRKHSQVVGYSDVYKGLVDTLREEIGSEKISNEYDVDKEFDVWLRTWPEIDLVLSSIELAAQLIFVLGRNKYREDQSNKFVATVNARMLEDGVGYQLEDYAVVRLDSKFIHSEVVVPALFLLSGKAFSVPNAEFRQAHKEYVDGNYEDCIHDCCNAFESVLKVILTGKKWEFDANDPAKKLLNVAFSNGLIPPYMQTEFTGLRTILESGVPTVRNKDGGHGAGVNPRNIPAYIASFQLHQTAAAIVLLVEAAK